MAPHPTLPPPMQMGGEGVKEEDAHLTFLKAEIDRARSDAWPSLLLDAETCIERLGDGEPADEARVLKAKLHDKLGEPGAAVVELLKLLYLRPRSEQALQAKKTVLDIGERKFPRLYATLEALSKGAPGEDAGDRMAWLLERSIELRDDAFYEPLVAEFADFERRQPGHPKADELAALEAAIHQRRGRYGAAISAYRRLLALYPKSIYRARSQAAIADIYARNLKDYDAAIEAYQGVARDFPEAAEAQSAHVQLARLLEQQGRYALAIEVDEKIVALYPTTDAATRALQHEARLYRKPLKQPQAAIAALTRLADQHKGKQAVEALAQASDIAYDHDDYAQQAELLKRLAEEYPQDAQAPKALYDAGYAYERYAKDPERAAATYRRLAESYPDDKYARKAQSRLKSLAPTN